MNERQLCTLRNGASVYEIDWLCPDVVFATLAEEAFSLWLDSTDGRHPQGRYSFIATDPYLTRVVDAHQSPSNSPDPFALVAADLREAGNVWQGLSDELDDCLPPFRGGAAGVFSYDLAGWLEKLPVVANQQSAISNQQSDQGFPVLTVGLYDTVLAFDHVAHRSFIFSTGLPEVTPTARARRIEDRLGLWRQRLNALLNTAQSLPPLGTATMIEAGFSRHDYQQVVQSIVEHILAGDIFQANISQRFRARLDPHDSAFAYYQRLRQCSPAPFSAFGQYGDWAIASASPERFIQLCRGRVESKPIKGTCPRGRCANEDKQRRVALLNSQKDRAENTMIVDLLRNDLARVCQDDSIEVPVLCGLESFSHVHHLVSTITGRLRPDQGAIDLLKACFPGGSVTGAPKIRAMELIARYEPNCRGPYCGAIGYIGFDDRLDMSITIRTALLRDRLMSFQVGGAITANSDCRQEYDETIDKAVGLVAALGLETTVLTTIEKQIA